MHSLIKGTNLSARVAPSLVGIIALVIVAGLAFSGEHSAYVRLLTFWGFEPFRFPFVDLGSSLAAWDCSRKGVDVIINDPCDVLAGGFAYSPFWMTIDWIPLGQPDRVWVGMVLAFSFLVSLSALPPAVSTTETALRIAAVLSSMVAFAIERANLDILIFLLVVGALPLLRRSAIAKAFGYGLVFLAGAIKYYPFILFGLVARERLRLGIPIAVAFLVALAAFFSTYANQIHEGLPHIVRGLPFGDMFGAKNLLFGMFLVCRSQHVLPMDPVRFAMITTILVPAIILWAMIRLWQASDIPAAMGRIDEARRIALLAGALLLSGCFFAGQSIAYRGIFLFLVIPGLSALAQDRDAGAIASAARLAVTCIPILMWTEAIRQWVHLAVTGSYLSPGFHIEAILQPFNFLPWFGRELAWWFLIAFLLTVLIGGLVAGPLGYARGFRRSLRPKV